MMVLERLLVIALFLTGLYALAAMSDMIRKVFGLTICGNAVVLLFVLEGSRIGSQAPIHTGSTVAMVDPLPQALMLTAIVIGVCLNSLALALVYRLYKIHGTLDFDTIRQRDNTSHD